MHIQHLAALCGFITAALSTPVPARGTESGGGIAPYAGNGPKPSADGSQRRVGGGPASISSNSAVPVGSIIRSCTTPGVVALTFDDGPYIYTSAILDALRDTGAKATFFINGDNWGNILNPDNQAIVQRTLAEGHQIGSHTWAHRDLATLDRNSIVEQMDLLSNALLQIVGKYPTYMRPPYFSTNGLVLQTMSELGFHVVEADIDTLDWANNSQDGIQTSVQHFIDGLNGGGTISLSHDVHQWTANTLVRRMIEEVSARGLRTVTVGECLGDPQENWYRT